MVLNSEAMCGKKPIYRTITAIARKIVEAQRPEGAHSSHGSALRRSGRSVSRSRDDGSILTSVFSSEGAGNPSCKREDQMDPHRSSRFYGPMTLDDREGAVRALGRPDIEPLSLIHI